MPTDYRDMGYRIREIRKQQGLTQAELAEKADISASYLGHVERATRIASIDTLVNICNALQISPEHLLQASLQLHDPYPNQELSPENRHRLNEFLRLAEDAVRHWND